MITILNAMKKKKYGISENVIAIFEDIINQYDGGLGKNLTGVKCDSPDWDNEFSMAMRKYLTQEQRFRLYEDHGACNGTGADKERRAFAQEHALMPLDARMELFSKTFGRWKPVLNDDNTLTLTFKCTHGYYRQVKLGKINSMPSNADEYFGRCAGGRLYELQKALGIKLKIKSVDVTPLKENLDNPVVFTYEIV